MKFIANTSDLNKYLGVDIAGNIGRILQNVGIGPCNHRAKNSAK